MASPAYDLVIRNGRLATASDDFVADIGIRNGVISALADRLDAGREEIDATGKLVLPGGVDSHCHIEQLSAGGLLNADTFESATVSAAVGGTTTVIPFAAQHRGNRLRTVVEDYARLAAQGAVVDYTFHLIVTETDDVTLQTDLPALAGEGHGSIKVFMTYDLLKVDDSALLDVLASARETGSLVCVHAENHGMIAWMSQRLVDDGKTAPKFHAVSHPRAAEVEAIHRLILASELLDQPVMVFHVSTAEGADLIRSARQRGVKVYGETCPQYLFLTADDLDKPGLEGAKWMCSPPPRTRRDQEALWQALGDGALQVISSDHAPYRFDETGKLSAGASPTFKEIANGLPGLQWRMPLLFDAMISRGPLGLQKFVELTATAPAKIYNLHPKKGTLAIGSDADLVIWDPEREMMLSDSLVQDRTGYTPYVGRTVRGWPIATIRRGDVIVRDGQCMATPGSGVFLPRTGGAAAAPSGRKTSDAELAARFGAAGV
ncbi:MAG: dihydropyrimidinase [Pseudomonadota bacterium]